MYHASQEAIAFEKWIQKNVGYENLGWKAGRSFTFSKTMGRKDPLLSAFGSNTPSTSVLSVFSFSFYSGSVHTQTHAHTRAHTHPCAISQVPNWAPVPGLAWQLTHTVWKAALGRLASQTHPHCAADPAGHLFTLH